MKHKVVIQGSGRNTLGFRVGRDPRKIPSTVLRAGSSLRLKCGCAQDDAGNIKELEPYCLFKTTVGGDSVESYLRL